MLDLKYVIANTEVVRQNCRNRNVPDDVLEDIDRIVALEGERKGLHRPSRKFAAGRTRWPRPPAGRKTPTSVPR